MLGLKNKNQISKDFKFYPIFLCVLFGADFAEEVEAFAFGVVVFGAAFFVSFLSIGEL